VSVADILVIALLAFGVAMELTSVLGILVGADVYARLHFTGPASTFTPIALAVAIAIHFGAFSQAGIKAAITAGLIVVLGPALVHATARAARIRQKGEIE
jgi:multisubunit Na+/H+ antiporter MnhG subunit